MKKKGFTLVELLGVVVVLAIIALISVPIVINIIENVKKGAIKSSAYGLMESANIYYAKNMDKITDPIEFEINKGVQISGEKLSYKGTVDMGYLMLFKNGQMAVCVDDGTYSAHKSVDEKEVTVEEGICTGEYDEATKSYMVSQTSSGFTSISIRSYSDASELPSSGKENDIAVITNTKITGYYISGVAPTSPTEGMVWIVESPRSTYYLESKNVRIGVSYVMQYEDNKWNLKHAYVYNKKWTMLYYVDIAEEGINLENSNLGDIEVVNNFEYTGEYQEFTAPFSGYYNIQLWGAQGGSNGSIGGRGAYTSGDIYLNIGETIYVYVGQQGQYLAGGWNGGGSSDNGNNRGGGGATDIRLESTPTLKTWNEFNSLKSRIMVAAGGGGAGYSSTVAGAGGGLTGYDGSSKGGTQAMAGRGPGYDGGFGFGGAGANLSSGGGSGYYGGSGSSACYACTGGGGSSYISGHVGVDSISVSSDSTNMVHNGEAFHYSGKFFLNTVIIDGNGYNWTTIKSTVAGTMPSIDGTVTVGNIGNGHAKISLKSIEVVTKEEIDSYIIDNQTGWNYFYNGNVQEFVAQVSGYYNIQLWGAQGGNNDAQGGLGAYTSGDIYLKKGQILYVYAGGISTSTAGGWNGGGAADNGNNRGGGGATDIRLVKGTTPISYDSLSSRIMVAGAGGGGGTTNVGGAAGGLSGYSATGVGGNTNVGGSGPGYAGGFGHGGNGSNLASGGGSGYYGGAGSSSCYACGGGGGSSYISGHEGVNSLSLDSISSSILHNGSRYHISGYYFINTTMIDGQGYSWNTNKSATSIGMPSWSSSAKITGNSGNGHAKINFISAVDKSAAELKEEQKSNNKTWFYNYNGKYQEFLVEKNGYYKFELWGAQGGTSSAQGGLGGYTYGEIYLKEGTKLYIYVGGTAPSVAGGWNGGGSADNGNNRGGGGATDIRTIKSSSLNIWNEKDSLISRIMVAGGGGGGGSSSSNIAGASGGLIGYNGNAAGGTQIAGGIGPGYAGGFGHGGNTSNLSSGGGSGYYGGSGSSNCYACAGGGGSSYISGHAGCIAVDSTGNPKVTEYSALSDSVSYTGYKFTNTQMIDGQGYNWTVLKSSKSTGMPTHDGTSTMTGNSGNGYAKITYLGE